MGYFKDTIKGTYKFAREELSSDIKRIPGAKKSVKRIRKMKSKGTKGILKSTKKAIKITGGKKISNKKAFAKIGKSLPKSKYKRAKYKRKSSRAIKKEIFGTKLNLDQIY